MVFPDHEESNNRLLKNRIPKSVSDLEESDVNTFLQESPLIFPEVKLNLLVIEKINKNKIIKDKIKFSENKIINDISIL